MSAEHVHLMFNHFPLIGFIFSFLILILGFVRSNESVIRVGFLIILVSGLLTVPTYLSGEEAEHKVEELPTASKEWLEEHEAAAWYAIWAIGFTSVAATAGLYLSNKKGKTPKPVLLGVMLLNLFSLTVIARTNYLGGPITHSEIRDGLPNQPK